MTELSFKLRAHNLFVTLVTLCLCWANVASADTNAEFEYDPPSGPVQFFSTLGAAESAMRSEFSPGGEFLQRVSDESGNSSGQYPPTKIEFHYEFQDQPWTSASGFGTARYESGQVWGALPCTFEGNECSSFSQAADIAQAELEARYSESCESVSNSVEDSEYWFGLQGGRPNPAGFPQYYFNYKESYRFERKVLAHGSTCEEPLFIEDSRILEITKRQYMECPAGLTPASYLFGQPASNESELTCQADVPNQKIVQNNRQNGSGECVGNPCDPITGNKYLRETDYSGAVLQLTRAYNSMSQSSGFAPGWVHNWEKRLDIGASFGYPIFAQRANGMLVPIQRGPSGDSNLYSAGQQQFVIEPNPSGPGMADKIVLHLPDGSKEVYDDDSGRLDQEVSPEGWVTSLVYEEETAPLQTRPRLRSVIGHFGHSLTFTYEDDVFPYGESSGRLYQVAESSGRLITYEYDAVGNLEYVTYPDLSQRQYLYENGLPAADLPHHLTGIIDERGLRISTYEYQDDGRATVTERTGGFQRFEIEYDTGTDGVEQNTVTEVETGRTFTTDYVISTTGTGQILASAGGVRTDGASFYSNGTTYDPLDRARVSTRTDENGNVTTYGYDQRHVISMTEATGDADLERTTFYDSYVSDLHALPTLIRRPSVYEDGSGDRQDYTIAVGYGDDLLPDSLSETGFTADGQSISRTTSMTYWLASDGVTHIIGKLKEIDGPRANTDDRTAFDWYDCDTGAQCGQIKSITRFPSPGITLVTRYEEYNGDGNPTKIIQPNGLVIDVNYDQRVRVQTVTQNPVNETGAIPRTTSYQYWPNGLVHVMTLPSGGTYTYEYDAADLLRTLTASDGDYIEYDYDLRGNRTSEKIIANGEPISNPSYAMRYKFDINKNLEQSIGAVTAADVDSPTSGILNNTVYDGIGNLRETEILGLNNLTTLVPDALNRVSTIEDPEYGQDGLTTVSYDVADNVSQVEKRLFRGGADSGSVTTTYKYDDFGNVREESSPDRGLITYDYDSANNLTSMVDARGNTASYTYDSINRRLTAKYFDGSGGSDQPVPCYDVDFTYDVDEAGVPTSLLLGELSSVSDHPDQGTCDDNVIDQDATGPLVMTYNAFGEVKAVSRKIEYVAYRTDYVYDQLGNVQSMTYPSGKTITYQRDNFGDVIRISRETLGDVLDNVKYEPFGLLKEYTFGNGLLFKRTHDLQYRIETSTLADGTGLLHAHDYDRDDAGNITMIDDQTTADNDQSYQYDSLFRLDYSDTLSGTRDYEYDSNDNRESLSFVGEGTGQTELQSLLFEANSNRLDSVTSPASGLLDYALDASGNIDRKNYADTSADIYHYSEVGRLREIKYRDDTGNTASVATYIYDGFGRRFQKNVGGNVKRFWFGTDGKLLAEFDSNGVILAEYIYLDGRPVAVVGSDRDGDGVPDAADNCVDVPNPGQENTNAPDSDDTDVGDDLFGNACDTDLNNDGVTNVVDLGILRAAFFSNTAPDEDFNSDGVVNVIDLGILRLNFFEPPGPSAAEAGSSASDSFSTELLYVHSDWLDTPVSIYDSGKVNVWERNQTPFGLDDGSISGVVHFNLRFQGQYYDSESGLHYNFYRTYDPVTGRYLESDPIGLDGGINTFSYAYQRPMGLVDPFGLEPKVCGVDEMCQKLKRNIMHKHLELLKELRKFDPVADARGGPIWKPDGHRIEIRNLRRGIKNDITRYNKICRNDDGPGGPWPPIDRSIDEMANRPLPPKPNAERNSVPSNGPSEQPNPFWWVIPVLILLPPTGLPG